MKNQLKIEERVEQALSSLDGVQRAQANPFLFTRIQQKLANRQPLGPWEKAAYLLTRPALAVLVVLAFLAINLYVANREQRQRLAREQQQNEQLFAAEYNSSFNELNPNR